MQLFERRRESREDGDLAGRLEALERYADYLREQGEYGFSQAGKRLDALEHGRETS